MANARAGSDEVVSELVGRLFGVVRDIHKHVERIAARHELTVPQALLLRRLEGPLSMRALADGLSCDPSNVTGLIDRIESLGFVERTADPTDRRVRVLALTAAGRKMRTRIEHELTAEGSPLGRLSRDELDRLLALLRRLTPSPPSPGTSTSTRASR